MLTVKSKVKDILANDEAYEIVKKHMPLLDRDDPRMAGAMNMSLMAFIAFPATGVPKDVRQAIADDLEDAEIE